MIESPFDKPKNVEVSRGDKSITEEVKEVREIKEEVKQEGPKEEPEYMTILREHGGLESNIPIRHRYWQIRP